MDSQDKSGVSLSVKTYVKSVTISADGEYTIQKQKWQPRKDSNLN